MPWTSAFAIGGVLLWGAEGLTMSNLLESARPERIGGDQAGAFTRMVWKDEHLSHEAQYKVPATLIASATALAGFLFAVAFYGLRKLDPEDVRDLGDRMEDRPCTNDPNAPVTKRESRAGSGRTANAANRSAWSDR